MSSVSDEIFPWISNESKHQKKDKPLTVRTVSFYYSILPVNTCSHNVPKTWSYLQTLTVLQLTPPVLKEDPMQWHWIVQVCEIVAVCSGLGSESLFIIGGQKKRVVSKMKLRTQKYTNLRRMDFHFKLSSRDSGKHRFVRDLGWAVARP